MNNIAEVEVEIIIITTTLEKPVIPNKKIREIQIKMISITGKDPNKKTENINNTITKIDKKNKLTILIDN